MDWRKRYADKLRTAEEAVADVRSGQAVVVAMFDGMPPGLPVPPPPSRSRAAGLS